MTLAFTNTGGTDVIRTTVPFQFRRHTHTHVYTRMQIMRPSIDGKVHNTRHAHTHTHNKTEFFLLLLTK
ncbi:Uncharacterized protein APZ42_024594 [Daphnia magna]|uniref:Uncharacterized protein n=1 Tax=Daphnia magna TaxID=35525 RepID=A0A164U0A0_9CRUS|nr:Uncharacterized protein APZ42_024594 [Daphnia magna]